MALVFRLQWNRGWRHLPPKTNACNAGSPVTPMTDLFRKIAALMVFCALLVTLAACGGLIVEGKASAPLSSDLLQKIKSIGSTPGAAMMMRIFKKDSILEVWKQTNSGQYALLTTYKICAYSGGYGPKIVEGDRQAPEGFYDITPGLLNPNSNYYLAFNTGYPNKFDRSYGRTGSNLMVHGDCSSSGCYAMTDAEIAEIYTLGRESLAGGNKAIQLEIFPFRMTPENLASENGNTNMAFWQNIKTGYDAFELTRKAPTWDVCDKKYIFNSVSANGQPLDAAAPCPALVTDPTLMAAISAKQAGDNAALSAAVSASDAQKAADAAAAQKAADEKAALAARGNAIGGFFSGILGGNKAAAPATDDVVTDPDLIAPIPMPPLQRT